MKMLRQQNTEKLVYDNQGVTECGYIHVNYIV